MRGLVIWLVLVAASAEAQTAADCGPSRVGMSAPDCQRIVEILRDQYPDEWRNAHTGNARTEDFIKRLAWVLHSQVDRRFGLLGQYGNPNQLADDAILWLGDGNGTDTVTGGRQHGYDVIAGAGGTNPQPAWGLLNGGGNAAWVQPQPVSGGGGNTGGGTSPPPSSVDLRPVLDAIAALSARLDAVDAKADAASREALNAALRALELLDAVRAIPTTHPPALPVTVPCLKGRVPKAFGGSSEVVFCPQEP